MSKIGLNDLSAIYVGSAEVGKAYLGNSVVYEKASSVPDYLVIEAIEPSTVAIEQAVRQGFFDYSYDGVTWARYYSNGTQINLSAGDKVCIRGKLNGFVTTEPGEYNHFVITGNVKAYGKLEGLTNYDNTATEIRDGEFMRLFSGCTALTDASGIVLSERPTNNIYISRIYYEEFKGCTNLVRGPRTISCGKPNCGYFFTSFYEGCTSLQEESVLDLPAMTKGNCDEIFRYFYKGCTSLRTANSLSGVTFVDNNMPNYAIAEMYSGCSSVTSAYLPGYNMRSGRIDAEGFLNSCTSLTEFVCLLNPSTTMSSGWIPYFSSGEHIFYKHPEAVWSTGSTGVPGGWTVQDYTET